VSVAGVQIECQTGEACVVVGEAAGQSRDILVETDGRAVAASYLSVAH